MQWLNELPFADNRVLQIGFLAACGIAALIVLAIVYRLAFAHRLRVPGGRTRQPRLGLVDAFSLDGQRQLVLVRRDNVEHLVMIGGPNDVLVESQINRAAVPARESNQASPLLVPSTPVRRTEAAALPASAAAEAPAKVAAKAPASPPAPAPAAPLAPRAHRLRRPRRPGARSSDSAPSRRRRSRRRQLPAARSRPSISFPPKRLAPEPARARIPCAAGGASGGGARSTSAGEFAAAASGRSALPRSRVRRCPRRSSPPAARRTGRRRSAPEQLRERPGQSAGLVSRRAFAAAPSGESGAGSRRLEGGAKLSQRRKRSRPRRQQRPPSRRPARPAQPRPAPRTPPSAPTFDGAQKPADARPPGDKTNAASSGKPRSKSTILSPTSIRSKRRWRACSAAKSPINSGRRRCGGRSLSKRRASSPIAPTTLSLRKRR